MLSHEDKDETSRYLAWFPRRPTWVMMFQWQASAALRCHPIYNPRLCSCSEGTVRLHMNKWMPVSPCKYLTVTWRYSEGLSTIWHRIRDTSAALLAAPSRMQPYECLDPVKVLHYKSHGLDLVPRIPSGVLSNISTDAELGSCLPQFFLQPTSGNLFCLSSPRWFMAPTIAGL